VDSADGRAIPVNDAAPTSDPAPPLLVRAGGLEAVFGTALDEVVAGDGRGCLIRVEGEGVREGHLVLRVREGRWVAEALGPGVGAGGRRELVEVDAPVLGRLGERGPQIELAPARETL